MRSVLFAIVVASFILMGCLMNHSDNKIVSDQSGAKLNVSINAGPVANTAILRLSLSKIPGFEAGTPVEIIIPEKEIKAYLKEQNNSFEVNVGKTKNLAIDAPKTFFVSIRSAKNKKGKNLYILDKNASLLMDVPYSVLQQIHLIIVANKINIDVQLPKDDRSSAQVNIDKLDNIIRVNNPPAN